MLLLQSESSLLLLIAGSCNRWTRINQIFDVVMEQAQFEKYLDLTSEEESSKVMTVIAQ